MDKQSKTIRNRWIIIAATICFIAMAGVIDRLTEPKPDSYDSDNFTIIPQTTISQDTTHQVRVDSLDPGIE